MPWLAIGVLATTLFLVGSMELPPKCEPLTAPMCIDLRQHYKTDKMYNMTIYPNSLEHRNQIEAALELRTFSPLVSVGCSKYMKLFLCTIYAPMCSQPLILPCRSLCEEVRNGCLPLMQKFGFKWPDAMKCEKFPRITEKVCFGGPSNNTDKDKGMIYVHCFSLFRLIVTNKYTKQQAAGIIYTSARNNSCLSVF